jgi:hypothetical protein
MKREEQIPYYACDGTSLGFRSVENARRLVDGGFVEASWGRKGHLKAIWARQQDGSSPVEANAPTGTKYSFPEKLDSGRSCWKHRRLDRATKMARSSPRAAPSSRWLRIAQFHESSTTNRCPAHRLDAWRVPWRPGAPAAAGGTNRPTRSRTAQHGAPGRETVASPA